MTMHRTEIMAKEILGALALFRGQVVEKGEAHFGSSEHQTVPEPVLE